MATIDAAKAIHCDHEIGSIEEGKKADLVVLDLERPNTLPHAQDIHTRIVFSASPVNVELVLVDGRIIKTGNKKS